MGWEIQTYVPVPASQALWPPKHRTPQTWHRHLFWLLKTIIHIFEWMNQAQSIRSGRCMWRGGSPKLPPWEVTSIHPANSRNIQYIFITSHSMHIYYIIYLTHTCYIRLYSALANGPCRWVSYWFGRWWRALLRPRCGLFNQPPFYGYWGRCWPLLFPPVL